jgi:Ala-tRNA(Pro) deacylase
MATVTHAQRLFAAFDAASIKYQNIEHKPVLTCEDQKSIEIPAPHTKNLFLKDKGGKFWLVAALDDTNIQLKTLASKLNVRELRFGNPESLMEHLGVKPGAVSIFALINDEKRSVSPVVDERIFEHENTAFHPLHNEATTVIASKDLIKFFDHLRREYTRVRF